MTTCCEGIYVYILAELIGKVDGIMLRNFYSVHIPLFPLHMQTYICLILWFAIHSFILKIKFPILRQKGSRLTYHAGLATTQTFRQEIFVNCYCLYRSCTETLEIGKTPWNWSIRTSVFMSRHRKWTRISSKTNRNRNDNNGDTKGFISNNFSKVFLLFFTTYL